jgi:branched-chain amino acid transport system ATP-binding protein
MRRDDRGGRPAVAAERAMTAILEISDLRKAFGGIHALDGVSFHIEQAGIYGLIGPNGAGKTTLFDSLTGLLSADSGTIRFGELTLSGHPPHALAARGLARTFQECRIFGEESCLDNLLFAVQDKRLPSTLVQILTRNKKARQAVEDRARRLLSLVNLDIYADDPANILSFGQKRLLEIVSAFMTEPKILLLDEPASGVNPALLDTLSSFIRQMYDEKPIVFLIVEHNMDFIMRLADHIIVMHRGQVLEQGTPEAVQASPRVIEAYLG